VAIRHSGGATPRVSAATHRASIGAPAVVPEESFQVKNELLRRPRKRRLRQAGIVGLGRKRVFGERGPRRLVARRGRPRVAGRTGRRSLARPLGLLQPRGSLLLALGHPIAVQIGVPEVSHGLGVSQAGGPFVAEDGFGGVWFHSAAVGIHHAEPVEHLGVVTGSSLAVPANRLPVVLPDPAPVCIRSAEVTGGLRVALPSVGHRRCPTKWAGRLAVEPDARPVDCLVVTRGGGSLEDLWAFNEEVVVRAIFASRIPVISAVGHEIDVTLSDLVADVRALTPSEAAELMAPAADELAARLRQYERRLLIGLRMGTSAARARLDALARHPVFRRPYERVHELARRLDEAKSRLSRAIHSRIRLARQQAQAVASQLQSLSPLGVLGRGYSLTQRAADGRTVRDARELTIGDAINTHFARGQTRSRVEQIQDWCPGGPWLACPTVTAALLGKPAVAPKASDQLR
jgi:hypothetical protein